MDKRLKAVLFRSRLRSIPGCFIDKDEVEECNEALSRSRGEGISSTSSKSMDLDFLYFASDEIELVSSASSGIAEEDVNCAKLESDGTVPAISLRSGCCSTLS